MRPPTAPVRALLSILALVGTALLAGCGGEETPADPAGHNAADVAFATEMIPHHADALRLVDLTVGRDLSPEVATLADGILQTQTLEVEQMTDWLEQWGEPIPATSRDHVNAGHGEDGHGGDGEHADGDLDELAALAETDGAAFERRWLELMVEHHEAAVAMAEEHRDEGQYGEALALADEIAASQRAELEAMRALLEG